LTRKIDSRASLTTLMAIGAVLSPMSVAVADAPAVSGGATGELEEIVVTATKQSLALQKTAAAITALDGDALVFSGVTDIRGAQQFVPSVRFQAQTSSTEIYLRGVGSTLDLPQIESPTALNFDSVYIPREATSVPLYDVQQIEVLPGPQGTLYGRSVMGGTVNVSFHRQEFETLATLDRRDSVVPRERSAEVPRASVRDAPRGHYLSHDTHSQAPIRSGLGRARLVPVGTPTSRRLTQPRRPTKRATRLGGEGRRSADQLVPDQYLQSNPWNDRRRAVGRHRGQPLRPAAQDQKYDNDMVSGD
jgi:iron complex outermembrane receptor protein